jgi:hypothetical protein
MVGSLKASVSQLEFENEKLKKDVSELKAENNRLDTQLSQEKDFNGEITARLDDAKDLIRRQGGSAQALGTSSRSSYEDDVPPPISTPPSKSRRGARNPPTAQIPSQTDPAPFGSSGDGLGYRTNPVPSRDLGNGDDVEDHWLPVARGMGTAVRQ